MVGVPGKYKGCNTCRSRRVKCDNQRPLCRKCVDSGRECLGYERETVFIVGTVEDKGRCSSHPPRNLKGPKKSPSPPRISETRATESVLVPVEPLQPAWSDQILVSNAGRTHRLRIAALHIPLSAVGRGDYRTKSETTVLSLPSYTPIDVQPTFGNADFELRAQCLSYVPQFNDKNLDMTIPESVVLFLYEQNSSLASSNLPPWSDPVAQQSRIRQLGPGSFRTFPSHHFYARVYRPSAITTALLNRKATFCADPEWAAVPFELHPKGPLDRLLDLAAQLPALLQRLDQLLVLGPNLARRLLAQDLLGNCLNLQAQLEQWLAAAALPGRARALRDPQAALSLTYYWSVQALVAPCLETLTHSILSPVMDAYPAPSAALLFPDLLAGPRPGEGAAAVVRGLAADVCRGLDCALAATAQPDLLAFPVQVAEDFYGALSVQAGEGALELMWLASFRGRMAARGQELAGVVAGRGWADLAAW